MASTPRKFRVFIGSSAERKHIAQAFQSTIDKEPDVQADIWLNDTFAPSSYPLDSLIDKARAVDFAAFVFFPDDLVRKRGTQYPSVRDNVLFELGLFMGTLGRSRCFVLTPKNLKTSLPSDLQGIQVVEFNPPIAGREENDVSAACFELVRHVRSGTFRGRHSFESLEARGQLAKTYINATQRSQQVDIIALTLYCFVDNYPSKDLLNWIISEGKTVRILVLDPNSCSAALRGRQEKTRLMVKTAAALSQLKEEIIASLPRNRRTIRGRLEIRLYDGIPYMGYFRADKELIYGFNYPFLLGQQSDCLRLTEEHAAAPLYVNLTDTFERLWNESAGSRVFLVSARQEMALDKIKQRPLPHRCPLRNWGVVNGRA